MTMPDQPNRIAPERLLKLDEMAAECFVSRRTLERDIAAGRLRVVKIRRSTRVTRAEVERYKKTGSKAA